MVVIQKENWYGQMFNLATTDSPITILGLASQLVQPLNEPIDIKFVPISNVYGENYKDVEYRSSSLTKLRQHISYWEDTDLRQTIEQIIGYEKNRFGK